MSLAKSAELVGRGAEEVLHPFGRELDLEPGAELRVLGGDPDRALAGVADPVLLAAGGHESGRGEGHRVGAHGEGLGGVGRGPQAAGDDQRHAVGAVGVEEGSRPGEGEDGRDGGGVLDHLGGGPGGAGAAVDGDEVGSGGEGDLEIGLDVAGGELDPDGLAAGGLAQLVDLGS